jgi:hypothetical protein
MSALAGITSTVWLILAVLLLVLIVAWILLPLIMMSTNGHLKRILREQERTNALLQSLQPMRPTADGLPSIRADRRP